MGRAFVFAAALLASARAGCDQQTECCKPDFYENEGYLAVLLMPAYAALLWFASQLWWERWWARRTPVGPPAEVPREGHLLDVHAGVRLHGADFVSRSRLRLTRGAAAGALHPRGHARLSLTRSESGDAVLLALAVGQPPPEDGQQEQEEDAEPAEDRVHRPALLSHWSAVGPPGLYDTHRFPRASALLHAELARAPAVAPGEDPLCARPARLGLRVASACLSLAALALWTLGRVRATGMWVNGDLKTTPWWEAGVLSAALLVVAALLQAYGARLWAKEAHPPAARAFLDHSDCSAARLEGDPPLPATARAWFYVLLLLALVGVGVGAGFVVAHVHDAAQVIGEADACVPADDATGLALCGGGVPASSQTDAICYIALHYKGQCGDGDVPSEAKCIFVSGPVAQAAPWMLRATGQSLALAIALAAVSVGLYPSRVALQRLADRMARLDGHDAVERSLMPLDAAELEAAGGEGGGDGAADGDVELTPMAAGIMSRSDSSGGLAQEDVVPLLS